MATRPLKQQPERPPEAATAAPGFSLEDVKKLVALVEKSDVTHIAWQKGPERVVIKRGNSVVTTVAAPAPVHALAHAAPVAAPVPAALAAAPAAPAAKADAKAADKPGTVVTSPFVGTF